MDLRKVKAFSQRRQSAPSLIVTKALTKSKPDSRDFISQVSQDSCSLIQSLLSPTRKLISQGNVLLQTGLQTQERFLFLFTDLLVITKAKSVVQVKLKACVCVCDMWTASCVDEVCEGSTDSERSFVMGWPTYNCVATFRTVKEKERWLSLIESCIKEEKKHDDPKTIPLKIFAKDVGSCAYAKTLFINNTDSACDVISTALQQFGLSGGVKDYQLWVCSKKDTPYPLIGHELPYNIKMNHIHLPQKDTVNVSHHQEALLLLDSHCQFFLRPRRMCSTLLSEQKDRKRRLSLISWAFKRGSTSEQDDQSESPISPGFRTISNPGGLFGRLLSDVITDNVLPSPIVDMLVCLCNEGPVTCGIFRRSAGVKACRELREKLDSGDNGKQLSGESVFVIAAVFKDFLRNIPGSLLCEELYEQWLSAMKQDGERYGQIKEKTQIQEVQRLVQLLPKENLLLLRHIIAMLHHIQLNAEHNQMNSFNLAVCIAPSFLWNSSVQSEEKDTKTVCDLVHFLIDNCCVVFGDGIKIILMDLTEGIRRIHGSVGSFQQMSDLGYDSLKNELISNSEDVSKTFSLKGSHNMDSLISLSDCDFDQPDIELVTESPHQIDRIRNFRTAAHQGRSHKLQRHSVPTTGHVLKSHVQKVTLESDSWQQKRRMDSEANHDVMLVEYSFRKLKLSSKKDGDCNGKMEMQNPPSPLHLDMHHSTASSPVTSPAGSSVSSIDSAFSQSSDCFSPVTLHSPQNSPPKGQSDWFPQNTVDYQQPISLQNGNLCLSFQQRDSSHVEGSLNPKVSLCKTSNLPSYEQAVLHRHRKLFSQTLTQKPERLHMQTNTKTPSIGQLAKGRSCFYEGPENPMHNPLGDHQASPAHWSLKPNCTDSGIETERDPTDVKTEEELMPPHCMFYGQSSKSRMQMARGQNQSLASADMASVWQWRPSFCTDGSSLKGKVAENQAEGRSHRLRCCRSSQRVDDIEKEFHSEESYV